jgi:rhomboid protease GluP
MDMQTGIAFWFVTTVCLAGPIVSWFRLRTVPPGWCGVWAGIVAVALVGRLTGRPPIVGFALALWILLVAVPIALANLGGRLTMQRRYPAASTALRLAALLHPADGFREAPAAIAALELAFQGDLDAADAAFERLRQSGSRSTSTAVTMLCLLRQRWEDMLAWAAAHPTAVAREPNALVCVIRALGETGDVAGMIDRYDRARQRIDRFRPVTLRDTCRLMLFVFGGRTDVVDRILSTSFVAAPPAQNDFWRATARWAAGDTEAARREFDRLLPTADAISAVAIRRRLARIDVQSPPLDDRGRRLLAAEEARLDQEARYAPPVTPWSPRARVTRTLIAINVAAFAAEWLLGCLGDTNRMHDLGALCSGCVGRGEWWRLATSTVLHWNALHLTLNMSALAILGPAAEAALGASRFLAVYLFAGLGSMAAVVAVARLRGEPCVCVGASGAVMGLVGGTAAMMLGGWLRERAEVARGRGLSMVGFVAMQAALDAVVPQMSSTGHLAGAVLGFVAVLVLGDRLRGRTEQVVNCSPHEA